MSIVSADRSSDYFNQQAAVNCIPVTDQLMLTGGTYYRGDRFLSIEAVDGGGFVVKGHFPGKGNQTRVAIGLESLTCLFKEWIAQAK